MLEKKKKDIIDFVIFEENTSLHYPWNLSSEQISELMISMMQFHKLLENEF